METTQRVSWLAAVFAMILIVPACTRNPDASEIRRNFLDYLRAHDQRNGVRYTELITKASQDRYGALLTTALKGRKTEVLALRPADKWDVLAMRVMGERGVLRKLDGPGYCRWHIEQGWGGELGEVTIKLSGIRVSGTTASAEVVVGMFKTGTRYSFAKEDGIWKVDEAASLGDWDRSIKEDAAAENMKLDEYILGCITFNAGLDAQPTDAWDRMLN